MYITNYITNIEVIVIVNVVLTERSDTIENYTHCFGLLNIDWSNLIC
jgi:hypothetical protein